MSDDNPTYGRPKQVRLIDCPRCGSGVRPNPASPKWQCASMECRHEFEAEGEPAPMCGTKFG